MPLPILIIQLCDVERGDLFDDEFTRREIPFQRVHLYRNEFLPEPTNVRAAVILGSPVSVNDYQQHEWARELYQWTAKAMRTNLPLLGICFGSQLLAKILGATVSKHTHMELGVFEANLTEAGKQDSLFAGFPATFRVAHWHGDTWKIPFGASLLCEGDGCKNQAFRYANVIGIQFHLECGAVELTNWPRVYPQDVVVAGADGEKLTREFESQRSEIERLFGLFLNNWLKEV